MKWKMFLVVIFLSISFLGTGQSFDWRKDGFKNFESTAKFSNVDESGIDFEVKGLYIPTSRTDQESIQTGINDHAKKGVVHEYLFIFSEKVDLLFTISDVNFCTINKCFNDYLVFSGRPKFISYNDVKIINKHIVEPNHGGEFALPGMVNIQYNGVDTVSIKHGKGEGCNPGFIYISNLKFNAHQESSKKKDQKIVDILFDSNKSIVNARYKSYLDTLSQFLNKHSSAEINLLGFTDSLGEERDNLKLSNKRVVAVKNYLIEKNVSADRISIESYGESIPKESNSTDEGRQLNRRVEIIIVLETNN